MAASATPTDNSVTHADDPDERRKDRGDHALVRQTSCRRGSWLAPEPDTSWISVAGELPCVVHGPGYWISGLSFDRRTSPWSASAGYPRDSLICPAFNRHRCRFRLSRIQPLFSGGLRGNEGHLPIAEPGSQNFSAKADERRLRTVYVHAQHARAVDQSPNHARQKSWIALTDLACLLGFANDLFQHSEIPAAPYLCGAGFEQCGEHHFELGAMFVRKTGIGERHGVHLRRKTLSCIFSARLHNITELDKAGFAYGGKQGGFILEVAVCGRPRNTQLLANFS